MSRKSSEPAGCLLALLNLFKNGESKEAPPAKEYPYTKRRYLFSKAEKSFYLVLQQAMPQGYTLFAKVRLADVVEVRKGTEGRQKFFNYIKAKHIDFLICDDKWLEPRLVIELDDKSHEKQNRAERDTFLDSACKAAGLPVMRVRAAQGYDVRQLAQRISQAIHPEDSS